MNNKVMVASPPSKDVCGFSLSLVPREESKADTSQQSLYRVAQRFALIFVHRVNTGRLFPAPWQLATISTVSFAFLVGSPSGYNSMFRSTRLFDLGALGFFSQVLSARMKA